MLVDFYHLTASPVERVLPRLCERLLEQGQRLLVVAGRDLIDRLDEQLWSESATSFLPHGQADDPRAEQQPILLADDIEPSNGARNIALADGHWREDALAFDRAFYLFDQGRIEEARASWRDLNDRDGVERRYWKQDEHGKWLEGP